MAFITLRDRNRGTYELVNTDHIARVWAEVADEAAFDEIPTKLFLFVQYAGEAVLHRYIPVEPDGSPDVEVSSPTAAIQALAAYIDSVSS